jgi:hypothetical protein
MVTDNRCVGRPIGWNGGEVAFCNADVQVGTRFCFRCHIIAINQANGRVIQLQLQYARAKQELDVLIGESSTVITKR